MYRKENDSLIKAAFEWIPQEKKPRGKLRKIWLDGVEESERVGCRKLEGPGTRYR